MLNTSNLEIEEYKTRPRNPECAIDERMLIASYIMSKDVYMVVRDMRLRDWFFEDNLSREVYMEYSQICSQHTHDRAMAIAMSYKELAFTKAIRYFMEDEDGSNYKNQLMQYGDYALVSLLDTHLKERKRKEAIVAVGELQRKIEMNLPFEDCVAELDRFLPKSEEKRLFSLPEIVPMLETEGAALACETKLRPFDAKVRITEGGFLVVVGGESSSGKTSLTIQFAYAMAKDNVGRCIYFSTETGMKRLVRERMIDHIQYADNAEYDRAKEIMESLPNMYIDAITNDVDEIVASIRKEHKSKEGLKFVYIDYLQNLEIKGRFSSQSEQYESAVKKIHRVAQELHIVVFLLSQLVKTDSKISTTRDKPDPTLSTFRGSGQIGNSADVALILQRPGHGIPKMGEDIDTDCFVVKQKEGPQCKIPLTLLGPCFTFVERG